MFASNAVTFSIKLNNRYNGFPISADNGVTQFDMTSPNAVTSDISYASATHSALSTVTMVPGVKGIDNELHF